MFKLISIFISLSLFFTSSYAQHKEELNFNSSKSGNNYEPGTIVIKLKSSNSSKASFSTGNTRLSEYKTSPGLEIIDKELKALKVKSFKRPFPVEDKNGVGAPSKIASKKVDLGNIYIVKIDEGQSLEQAINLLNQNNLVEYAEPYYYHELLLIPNDPKADPTNGTQYQLGLVKAYDAWNVQRGDTNIVIGIIDSGVLLNHLDLKGTIKYNRADPINNIDDDNDGYVDNFNGWDFADWDSNPTADGSAHGTQVAGVSSAETNNSIGIAGTSFNSKFLPLKVFRTIDNRFARGFEAIKYAADKGCKVINLSWGSEGSYSKFEQNIIDYAVLEKDVVIVAAAGNSNTEVNYYPASYDNVLSVAATNSTDQKASFSTFSTKVDICAPGENVGTTFNTGEDSYGRTSGTSLASPIVAGAAALVRAKFRSYNALQVIEQLRVTADNIYTNSGNTVHYEKLGKGRLNMFRALTDTVTPSIRLTSFKVDNGGKHLAFYDDTIKIICDFKNYLRPTRNLKISLSSTSNLVTILKNQHSSGVIPMLGTNSNLNEPFLVYISPNAPHSTKITFRLSFEDGAYTDYQYFDIYTSPDYIISSLNNINFTATSKGKLGFKSEETTLEVNPLSSSFYGSGGIMFATSPTKVSNNVVNNISNGVTDKNLTSTRDIKFIKNTYADLEIRGTMVDTLNNVEKIGLVVTHKTYGWNNDTGNSSLIHEYHVTNFSGATIPELYSGFFADWNIDTYNKNRADWDPNNNLGYIYSSFSYNKMVGVALLTAGDPVYYALDNFVDNGNGIILNDGFSKQEKFSSLSRGVGKLQAGMEGDGSDVSQVVGVKLTNILNKGSVKVAFAIVSGNSIEELQNQVQKARVNFNNYQTNPPVSLTIGYCNNSTATIKRSNNNPFKLYESVPLDQPIYHGTEYNTPPLSEDKTYYITNEDEGFETEPTKVVAVRKNIVADFIMSTDTLDLIAGKRVSFYDNSNGGVKWKWNFYEQYQSTLQNPVRVFDRQGIYTIQLIVENGPGCRDSITKQLVVISTSPKPIVPSITVCKGSDAQITPSNGSMFRFYDSYPLGVPMFVGKTYSIDQVNSSRSIWVTNIDSLYESQPLEVKIKVSTGFASFSFSRDTLNLDEENIIHVTDLTKEAISWEWTRGTTLITGNRQASFSFNKVGIYPIHLLVQNVHGCIDTLTRNIIVARKSISPARLEYNFCSNQPVNIVFTEGKNFKFYNKYPNDLISQGSSLVLNPVSSDKIIYYTSSDSLIESSPAEIKIKVLEITAEFELPEDTLDLNESSTIEFVSKSNDAVQFFWDFGNGKQDQRQSSQMTYETTGDYTITLIATNSSGCTDTISKTIHVIRKDLDERVSLYPNPAKNFITVDVGFREEEPVEMNILNSCGDEMVPVFVQSGNQKVSINVSNFPCGMYFLKIGQGKKRRYSKFLVSH